MIAKFVGKRTQLATRATFFIRFSRLSSSRSSCDRRLVHETYHSQEREATHTRPEHVLNVFSRFVNLSFVNAPWGMRW